MAGRYRGSAIKLVEDIFSAQLDQYWYRPPPAMVVLAVMAGEERPRSEDESDRSPVASQVLPVTQCDNVSVTSYLDQDQDKYQSVIKMDLTPGVFDSRHADNTEVLLALLTQNKELEGTFFINSFRKLFFKERPKPSSIMNLV